MTRALLVLCLVAGCATTVLGNHTVLPRPAEMDRALAIVGGVYGVDLSRLAVVCFQSECHAGPGGMQPPGTGPGILTSDKGNCVRGALAPYIWQVNLACPAGGKLSDGGLPQAAWEAYEYAVHGLPDVYWTTPWWTSGLAPRKIAEAAAALKKAGL